MRLLASLLFPIFVTSTSGVHSSASVSEGYRLLLGRSMWARQDVSPSSIQEHWMAIRDRRWAVASCLDRAASSEQGQLLLLRAGLQETEAALSQLQSQGGQQAQMASPTSCFCVFVTCRWVLLQVAKMQLRTVSGGCLAASDCCSTWTASSCSPRFSTGDQLLLWLFSDPGSR